MFDLMEGKEQRCEFNGVDTVLKDDGRYCCVPVTHSDTLPQDGGVSFAVEYLPGQFDQRADSASECIQLISQGERPEVRSAKV